MVTDILAVLCVVMCEATLCVMSALHAEIRGDADDDANGRTLN